MVETMVTAKVLAPTNPGPNAGDDSAEGWS